MNLSGVDLQGSNHSERRCRHGASFLKGTVASHADAAPPTFFFFALQALAYGGLGQLLAGKLFSPGQVQARSSGGASHADTGDLNFL